jgi:hypothetical protein
MNQYLKYLFSTSCFILFLSATSFSQNNWVLKLDKEDIRVYTKSIDNSPFKAVRTVCTIEASLSRLTAVLLDINNSADWVYATKSCSLIKQSSPSELFYYSEVNVPWPASNRDYIVQLKVSQDEKTKVITVEGVNKPTFLPENKDVVRIHQSYSKWLIEPLKNGLVKVDYLLQVDPGGTVPAWLINMFATRGPFESFKNLRMQVKKADYNKVNLTFIKD